MARLLAFDRPFQSAVHHRRRCARWFSSNRHTDGFQPILHRQKRVPSQQKSTCAIPGQFDDASYSDNNNNNEGGGILSQENNTQTSKNSIQRHSKMMSSLFQEMHQFDNASEDEEEEESLSLRRRRRRLHTPMKLYSTTEEDGNNIKHKQHDDRGQEKSSRSFSGESQEGEAGMMMMCEEDQDVVVDVSFQKDNKKNGESSCSCCVKEAACAASAATVSKTSSQPNPIIQSTTISRNDSNTATAIHQKLSNLQKQQQQQHLLRDLPHHIQPILRRNPRSGRSTLSPFKGVHRSGLAWVGTIGFENKKYELGHWDSDREAALMYAWARDIVRSGNNKSNSSNSNNQKGQLLETLTWTRSMAPAPAAGLLASRGTDVPVIVPRLALPGRKPSPLPCRKPSPLPPPPCETRKEGLKLLIPRAPTLSVVVVAPPNHASHQYHHHPHERNARRPRSRTLLWNRRNDDRALLRDVVPPQRVRQNRQVQGTSLQGYGSSRRARQNGRSNKLPRRLQPTIPRNDEVVEDDTSMESSTLEQGMLTAPDTDDETNERAVDEETEPEVEMALRRRAVALKSPAVPIVPRTTHESAVEESEEEDSIEDAERMQTFSSGSFEEEDSTVELPLHRMAAEYKSKRAAFAAMKQSNASAKSPAVPRFPPRTIRKDSVEESEEENSIECTERMQTFCSRNVEEEEKYSTIQLPLQLMTAEYKCKARAAAAMKQSNASAKSASCRSKKKTQTTSPRHAQGNECVEEEENDEEEEASTRNAANGQRYGAKRKMPLSAGKTKRRERKTDFIQERNTTVCTKGLANPGSTALCNMLNGLGQLKHPSQLLLPGCNDDDRRHIPRHWFVPPNGLSTTPQGLTNRDIISGRGGKTNNNHGNQWYRDLVACYRPIYAVLPKFEKRELSENLVNYIRLQGGRFLEQQQQQQTNAVVLFVELGDCQAVIKTSQALREGKAALTREVLKRNLPPLAVADSVLSSAQEVDVAAAAAAAGPLRKKPRKSSIIIEELKRNTNNRSAKAPTRESPPLTTTTTAL